MINSFSSFLKTNYITLLTCISLIGTQSEIQAVPTSTLSPATQESLRIFEKIDDELGTYEGTLGKNLLNCSYVQDAWLKFLHDAETKEDFQLGMEVFKEYTTSFDSICSYATSVINFYTGDYDPPRPQNEYIHFHGKEIKGFLNTFKCGHHLSKEERELFFEQESSKYQSDCVVQPFTLDSTTLLELQAETVYNYVLLPDGKIVASLEKPGLKEYHVCADLTVVEAFQYPNHTILSGNPQQVVVTAGSFIFYQVDQKRLFFITCKSGHFQPTYHSLKHMKNELEKLGIPSSTIIKVPDVDLSQIALKIYKSAQVPVQMTLHDTDRLFHQALSRWQTVYQEIDKDLLESLANGNLNVLNPDVTSTLNKQREEATYMRSAYNLFSSTHQSPKFFHQFVKYFGKLKDAIKHKTADKIQSYALSLLKLMESDEIQQDINFEPADENSIYTFLAQNLTLIRNLLSEESLLIDEYHHVKKFSRELGALFQYLSDDAKWTGKKYFIFGATSDAFLQINEQMAAVHDSYISQLMHEDIQRDDVYSVSIQPKIVDQLRLYLKKLALCPPSGSIIIDQKKCWEMINWVKIWYFSHQRFFEEGSQNEEVNARSILEDIIYKNPQLLSKDYEFPMTLLAMVKRDAERARDLLLFLDQSHECPVIVHRYIENIECIISAMNEKKPEKACEAAIFVLDFCKPSSHPTPALETWQCTDQKSFNQVLKKYLNRFLFLKENASLPTMKAKKIMTSTQTFLTLMNAYKRYGASDDLPNVYFDSLEEHAEGLVKDLQSELIDTGEEITVTPSMIWHVNFILSKIQVPESLN